MPVTVLISTALIEGVKNVLSALRQERYREEGKAKGRAERDAEWIAWAENGSEQDKMPSVVNPVKPVQPSSNDDK